MNNSKRFTLNGTDLHKIAVGALMAALGALLTYLNAWVMGTDFTFDVGGTELNMTPVVVSVWAIVANAIRKLIADHSGGEPDPPQPPSEPRA